MDVIQYTAGYIIQNVGRWDELLNRVLNLGIVVKCVHISGRG